MVDGQGFGQLLNPHASIGQGLPYLPLVVEINLSHQRRHPPARVVLGRHDPFPQRPATHPEDPGPAAVGLLQHPGGPSLIPHRPLGPGGGGREDRSGDLGIVGAHDQLGQGPQGGQVRGLECLHSPLQVVGVGVGRLGISPHGIGQRVDRIPPDHPGLIQHPVGLRLRVRAHLPKPG